ncbi:MAG TPA: hypothetical protein VH684_25165 [Xanthobacteraceae bacterium]
MNAKFFAAAVVFAAVSTPALAQFWIVRDGPVGKCAVVDREPSDSKVIIAGGSHRFYSTRREAERDAQVVCRLRKA